MSSKTLTKITDLERTTPTDTTMDEESTNLSKDVKEEIDSIGLDGIIHELKDI